jgi:hypothetical protein
MLNDAERCAEGAEYGEPSVEPETDVVDDPKKPPLKVVGVDRQAESLAREGIALLEASEDNKARILAMRASFASTGLKPGEGYSNDE